MGTELPQPIKDLVELLIMQGDTQAATTALHVRGPEEEQALPL